MNRLDSIQMLRGVAALPVVIFHICTLSTDYANGVLFAPFTLIGNAGVDLSALLARLPGMLERKRLASKASLCHFCTLPWIAPRAAACN